MASNPTAASRDTNPAKKAAALRLRVEAEKAISLAEAAKQQVRAAKSRLKQARKLSKLAKKEAKQARKRAEAAAAFLLPALDPKDSIKEAERAVRDAAQPARSAAESARSIIQRLESGPMEQPPSSDLPPEPAAGQET